VRLEDVRDDQSFESLTAAWRLAPGAAQAKDRAVTHRVLTVMPALRLDRAGPAGAGPASAQVG
jgi:hypothetical protein